jgi:hypothetical protein
LPRRIVTHVLAVAAFEIGHPVLFVVLMESDDATLHDLIVTRTRISRRDR